jgi:hypothetical protein
VHHLYSSQYWMDHESDTTDINWYIGCIGFIETQEIDGFQKRGHLLRGAHHDQKRQISIDLGIGSISYIEHIACSAIYSASSWQKEVSQLAQLSQLSTVQLFFLRFFMVPMPFLCHSGCRVGRSSSALGQLRLLGRGIELLLPEHSGFSLRPEA